MQGVSCDYCRKFAPYTLSYGMFGATGQALPPDWIILTEQERPQQVMSGLLDVLSSSAPEQPRQPSVFCSRECTRDYLRAATLIDGAAAS